MSGNPEHVDGVFMVFYQLLPELPSKGTNRIQRDICTYIEVRYRLKINRFNTSNITTLYVIYTKSLARGTCKCKR